MLAAIAQLEELGGIWDKRKKRLKTEKTSKEMEKLSPADELRKQIFGPPKLPTLESTKKIVEKVSKLRVPTSVLESNHQWKVIQPEIEKGKSRK